MITTEYNLTGRVKETLTLAVVADLHEHEPAPVLEILKTVHPDIILVPGDLFENYIFGENLDKYDHNWFSRLVCAVIHIANKLAGLRWREKRNVKKENAYAFLREAGLIAPVYYSLGNHELYLTDEDKKVLEETGTTILNNSFVEFKGAKGRSGVFIGGIPSKQCTGVIDHTFLRSFREAPGYKILLCHHPEYYDELAGYADLIISGHCHGGQIRIKGRHGRPDRGIFAPGQGLFPKYHHGVYDSSDEHQSLMVVSSGCSNTASVPRFGNVSCRYMNSICVAFLCKTSECYYIQHRR